MTYTKYSIRIYIIINILVHVCVENNDHLIFEKLTFISLKIQCNTLVKFLDFKIKYNKICVIE